MNNSKGFTLLELMIVAGLLSILMAIALPSYTQSINKGRRSDAMASLLDVANRQEQFMFDHNRYSDTLLQLGFNADPMISRDGHYAIEAKAGNTGSLRTSYALTATARENSPQKNDMSCTSFTLTSTGTKTATGSDANNCWPL